MRETLRLDTTEREVLVDITGQVKRIVSQSGVRNGLVHLFAQHSSAALMLQENWDGSVPRDVVSLLQGLIPHGRWEHDQVDNNGDAHLKSGLVGPSETIPLVDGALALGTWQNVFFCEFDGPRRDRRVLVTVMALPEA